MTSRKSGLDKVSAVLPVRAASLARPGLMLRLAGAALAMLATVPFLSTPAKADLQHWANTLGGSNNALHQKTVLPGHYLQMAGHTDVAHSNSTQHGDQTDPWGTHIDTDPVHTDSAHVNTTTKDNRFS